MTEIQRSPELERARALLLGIEPPEGAKQRVLQAITLREVRRVRTAWRWGFGLAFLAATSAAAVADVLPVMKWVHRVIPQAAISQVTSTANEGSSMAASALRISGHVKAQPQVIVQPAPAQQIAPAPAEVAEEALPASPPSVAGIHHNARVASKSEPPPAVATPAPVAASVEPSELSVMVAQYQHAKSMAQQNPEQALKEFRAMQQRWPQGPLHQEADLQIVSLLSRLGREGESKEQANTFLKEHPESPHAGELQQLLKE